jgi:K+-transporting ATPase KdpF subunit
MGPHEAVHCAGERPAGRQLMNWLYLISGVIAFMLLVYLFLALLKPEKFE